MGASSVIEAITKERWHRAQVAERSCHTFGLEQGVAVYRESYKKMFTYLGMDFCQHGKSIIEIGPADFPALAYCHNYAGTIIEPMPSEHLATFCSSHQVRLITEPVEECDLMPCDEIWMFNLLQHVIDPELLVSKCKVAAKAIRYFEPVDYGTCEFHPHTFSQRDFERWFGGSVNRYTDRLEAFFDDDCVFGTWKCQ